MRVLVVDVLFPNRYATWRNNEIENFLSLGADVLVYRIDEFAGRALDRDWDLLHKFAPNRKLNTILFSPDNKLEGKTWRHKLWGLSSQPTYLITEGNKFNLKDYDVVFHIFLNCFIKFNENFNFPKERQVIHLYPGGGLSLNNRSLIPSNSTLISTQPVTSDFLFGHTRSIDCWTGPFFEKGDPQAETRLKNDGPLRIATASLGHPNEKGLPDFVLIAETFGNCDDFEFSVIGDMEYPIPSFVNRVAPMSYKDLEKFYREEVDVFLNLETGVAYNGWPLGLEAAKSGCVLLTTDCRSSAGRFREGSDVPLRQVPYVCTDVSQFVSTIRLLGKFPEFYEQLSNDSASFVNRWSCPEVQQDRYCEIIDDLHSAIPKRHVSLLAGRENPKIGKRISRNLYRLLKRRLRLAVEKILRGVGILKY